jgi:hypothetical protein
MASESKNNNILRALFCLFILYVVFLDVEIVLAQGPDINLTAEERTWLKTHPVITLGSSIFARLDSVTKAGRTHQEQRPVREKQATFDTEAQIEKLPLSPSKNEWLTRNRTITLAFDGYYLPYSFFNEDDEFQGLAVDFVQFIAKKTDFVFEYYHDAIWGDHYEAAKNNEVEALATMVQQPARLELLLFANPRFQTCFAVQKSKDEKK